ncbi:exo-beta-N-acetylmuramidase NamZ family protein [Sunxiuqinia sp. sy24]|uniref:exo-beta-N-acetylmuramidase NamZ family protein n=1 Tax=Sunxiuqinia sp. sy24 TaxID=3461495 RepID=UPI0040465C9E
MRIVWIFLFLIGLQVSAQEIQPGAERTDLYLSQLEGKTIGLVCNHTSTVGNVHLLDFLLAKELDVKRVFSPEHGFRGNADAGEVVTDQRDPKTGIEVVSLYGKNRKPEADQLSDLDVLIFDIQDVGVRFYTYISTMHYAMEACAENDKPIVIFDRPNPNGDYLAGPVLKPEFRSFVGMHPIPVVHGSTVGELARMINGEGWLENEIQCDLTVIPVANYTHTTSYSLPVKPSPNLPNDQSIRLYPSLCFFEATSASIGRGTYFPFQVIGYPNERMGDFQFTPESIEGMSKNPKQLGKVCYGLDLRNASSDEAFTLTYFLNFYQQFDDESEFLTRERWFNLLAGTDELLKEIRAGKKLETIEAGWQEELDQYQSVREKYLLYPDFN